VRGRLFDYLSARSAVSTGAINHERLTNRHCGDLLVAERQRERKRGVNARGTSAFSRREHTRANLGAIFSACDHRRLPR